MSIALTSGVYAPLRCSLSLSGMVWNSQAMVATIRQIELFAGAAIGSCVVNYASSYATDIGASIGQTGLVRIGGDVVFRGSLLHGPYQVDESSDENQLVFVDDKWAMQGRTVGQPGIGTQGSPAGETGFKDVGFDVVFNPHGKPNKSPSAREFSTGASAVSWTLKDVILFLFDYYVPTTVATCSTSALDAAYDAKAVNLVLTNMTALQAIDTVAQTAGQSWGLQPQTSASHFISVRPGHGTVRRVHQFAPRSAAWATHATNWHANKIVGGRSARNTWNRVYVQSGPDVIETTFESGGTDPLLQKVAGFKDKEYKTRYQVNVLNYAANNLGAALTSGSKPKPWLTSLVTRMKTDGTAYVTAAEIEADESLASCERVPGPIVWVSLTGLSSGALLCTGGIRVDHERACIDFKSTIEVKAATTGVSTTISVTDWNRFRVFCTAATVCETRTSADASSSITFPFGTMAKLVSAGELVRECRVRSVLPDLDGASNAVTMVAPTVSGEVYIPIAARLQAIADAAIASCGSEETPVEIAFPFFPVVAIGDAIELVGRAWNTSNLVVIEVSYDVAESYMTTVRASNVVAAADPTQLVEGRA